MHHDQKKSLGRIFARRMSFLPLTKIGDTVYEQNSEICVLSTSQPYHETERTDHTAHSRGAELHTYTGLHDHDAAGKLFNALFQY